MRDSDPTVYSTSSGRHCPKCGRPLANCVCKQTYTPKGDGIVRVLRETKGRKGKPVTLISGVPLNEAESKALLSDLKRICGAGGAWKEGVLEIQGDHRDKLVEELKKRGFTVKKAGG